MKGPFSGIILSKPVIFLVILSCAIVAQALWVIYTKQRQRTLYAQLQASHNMRDTLHNEWSQLLLEQGTWQAEARVEKIAREQLGMVVPDKMEVIAP